MPPDDRKPADDRDPDTSGSVDVQFSSPDLPAAEPPRPRRPRARTLPGRIGESITSLPVVKEVMPRTRRARVMVRSVVVAFALIASWIVGIVAFQLRGGTKPDLRPTVAAIFVQLRDGKVAQVYEESSIRFQEVVLEETFEGTVEDMQGTLGDFVEVAAVIRTDLFRGPSGRTAKVDLLLEFVNGRARGSMSFRLEDGRWRMLGVQVEIPESLAVAATSDEARAERVKSPPEVEAQVAAILTMSRESRWGEIWDAAAPVFQESISRADFIALEQQRRAALGPYQKILRITRSTQNPSRTGAGVDALIEFQKEMVSSAVAGSFRFAKIDGDWKLTFYKVILPMPRGAAE